jgi:hypothetical protein
MGAIPIGVTKIEASTCGTSSGLENRGSICRGRVTSSTLVASAMLKHPKTLECIKQLAKNKSGKIGPVDGKYIQYEIVDKNFILKYKDKQNTIPLKYIKRGSFDILARAVQVLHEDFAIPAPEALEVDKYILPNPSEIQIIEDKDQNYNRPCNIEIPCKIGGAVLDNRNIKLLSTIKGLNVGGHWFDESGRRLLKTDQCTINPQVSKDRLVLCVFDNGETKWLQETTIVKFLLTDD